MLESACINPHVPPQPHGRKYSRARELIEPLRRNPQPLRGFLDRHQLHVITPQLQAYALGCAAICVGHFVGQGPEAASRPGGVSMGKGPRPGPRHSRLQRPIQVWLSQVSENLALPHVARDAERAFQERGDASTIWLIPNLEAKVRWQEGPFERMLAIPSEHLDRIDIYHIGEIGRAFGLDAGNRFPQGTIRGLLAVWLTMPMEARRPGLLPEKASVQLPRFKAGRWVGYKDATIRLRSVTAFPYRIADEKKRVVEMSWPPEGRPIPISPDAESSDFYGDLSRTMIDGVPILTSAKHSELRSLPGWVEWPPIIRELMPRGTGYDELRALRSMVAIAEKSKSDRVGAFKEALDQARAYVSESTATREFAWLWPTVAAIGEKNVLLDLEDKLGLRAEKLEQLFHMPQARVFLDEDVPVRRAWGARGLFWALLLEQLESGGRFVRCERCGRPNPASRQGKRFCNRDDNEACFLGRTADYKRHARGKR